MDAANQPAPQSPAHAPQPAGAGGQGNLQVPPRPTKAPRGQINHGNINSVRRKLEFN